MAHFCYAWMVKKHKYPVLIVIVIICVVTGLFVLRQNSQEPPSSTKSSNYNPNYADAIQRKKPELCQNINYALQSGPTDGIDKVYGNEAVKLCESQAKAGFFGCECDSDTVLNNMRNR